MSAQLDFKDFKKDDLLTIQEAASLLEVSTKTLRRWEAQGIISPTRTPGNQRRYSISQIKQLKEPTYRKPIVVNYVPQAKAEPKKSSSFFRYFKLLIPALASIAIFSAIVYLNHNFSIGDHVQTGVLSAKSKISKVFSSNKSTGAVSDFELSQINHDSRVLAENTALSDYIFNINVPSLFGDSATFSAGLTAPNVIYGLRGGTGITVSSGQTPTISVGDELDSFGTITVGSTSIDAASSGDTLTIAAGSNVSIATDTTNKKITISSTDSDTFDDIDDGDDGQVLTLEDGDPVWADASGNAWTSSSGIIYPSTTTDNVVIGGNTTTSYQLEVNGTQTSTALVSFNETGSQNILEANSSGTNVLSITSTGLTFGSGRNLTLNSDSFTDLTGSGLAVSSSALGINLTTSGTTGSTSSNSGLEVSSSGLTLLKGCADNEVLKWTDSGGWACSTDTSGGVANYWQLTSNSIAPGGSGTVTDKVVIGGNTTTNFQLEVNGARIGKALVSLNETGDQNILVASASGSNVFSLDRSGNVNATGTVTMAGFKLTTGAASGYMIVSDGNGVGSWTDISTSGTAGPWTLSGNSLFPDATTSNLLVGSTTVADDIGKLTVSGTKVGKALAVLNDTGTDQNILTASASGVTVFNLNRSGSLLVAAAQGLDTLTAGALAIGNTTATSVSLCNSAACDTLSLGTNTDADTITIGEANDDVSLTDAQWSISAAGAGSFASLSSSGAIAANGGITFDNSSDTLGAFTLAGTVDANTNLITNIGDTGTDFVSGGGLTLAGTLTTNGTLTVNSDTITLGNATTDAITFTGRVAQDSDLLPITTTGTSDLGSSALPWDNVYAVSFSENGTALSATYAPINSNFVTVTANGTLTGETGIDALTTAISTTNTLNVDGATTLAGVTIDANSNLTLLDGTGKLGIGLTAVSKLDVQGAVVGKALVSFDEEGDQDLLTASASGVTKFRVANDGSIYVPGNEGLDTLASGGNLTIGPTLASQVTICNSNICDTIVIGTTTDADTITIGEANDNISITDAQWSISAAGAGSFVSVTSSGAIAANGGITFDDVTDTLGAHTLAGTIDANTNLITNIGDSGTDFVSGGGLTLAGTLTTNGTLTVNSDTITLGNATTDAITFTGRVAQDSDLLPITTTGTSDLGSSSLPWDNLYSSLISQPFAATSGTLHSISAPSSVTLAGALIGQAIDVSTNITASNNDITGQTIAFPAATFTATTTFKGISISGGALVQNQAATTGLFRGLEITNPDITKTAGTGLTATGNRIVTGTITTDGTQYGINVVGQGVSAGNLQALRINNITAGAGTETAISIQSGWDNDIVFDDTTVALTLTGSDAQIDFTDGTNTLFTIDDTGTVGNIDLTGTITAGSGNEILTLSTGKIDADAITLISSGTTGETSSRSGLETTSDGLSLITGCADGELIEWTDASGWACAADNDSGGAGAFTSSGGIITKTTGTDQLSLRFDASALGEVQLEIQNTTAAAAITADAAQINLTGGAGIVTDNVDGLYINIEGGDGTSADVSALHLDFDPITGSSDDTFTGLLIDSATGTSAVENAISVGSGWDSNLLFVDTTTQVQISDGGTLTFENVTGTDFLTLSAGTIVATGAVSGVTTLSSSGDWTWTSTTPNITINDNETFTIVDAATVDTFTINTSGSLFSYSDGTSSFTFDVDSGPTYAGSARPAKSIKLSPEYQGAILTASASATTVGTLTSDAVRDSTEGWENYYEWTSTQASLQDYTVAIKFTLPSDFSAWATSDAIKVNFVTEVTTNTKNKLDITLYNMTSTPDTPVAQVVTQASGTNAVWTSASFDDTLLDDGSGPDLDTAGQTGVLFLKVYSLLDAVNCTGGVNNGCYVRLGDIQLSYLAKF